MDNPVDKAVQYFAVAAGFVSIAVLAAFVMI